MQGIDFKCIFLLVVHLILSLIVNVQLLYAIFHPKPFPLLLIDLTSNVAIEDSQLFDQISDLHLPLVLLLTHLQQFVAIRWAYAA